MTTETEPLAVLTPADPIDPLERSWEALEESRRNLTGIDVDLSGKQVEIAQAQADVSIAQSALTDREAERMSLVNTRDQAVNAVAAQADAHASAVAQFRSAL